MGKNELLLYGLFFAVFLLFNYIMQQAAKRTRERQAAEQAAQQQEAAPSPEEESLEYLWGRKPGPDLPEAPEYIEPAPRIETIAAPAPAPAPRLTAPHALFRTTQDLRHAVVVMTILGPCRALKPYDEVPDR